jgi:hypothetical protein
MGEGGERRRVGVVVGGNVDGLQRGDGPATSGGDPLLQFAHLVGEGGLVAHGRRHAAEEGRHLGTGLHEPEDVVDEQQDVLVLDVAEVLGHGERRQGDAEADARGLVHLAEDQRGLVDDAGLLHLDPEVGALTGALADTGEHRHTTVLRGDSVDHLLDEDGLADAGTTEQADLAAGDVRGEEVDDLDPGREDGGLRLEGVERRRFAMDLPALDVGVGERRVEGLPDDVEHMAEHCVADGHGDSMAGVAHRGATTQAVGGLHGHDTHAAVTDLLRDLGGDDDVHALDRDGHLERGVDLGE